MVDIHITIKSILNLPLTLKLFLAIVFIPTVFAIIYYGLIASDIYIAEARFAVRSSVETPSTGLINSIFSSSSTSSGDDSLIVKDYILSRDMLDTLDNKIGLMRHYQSDSIDIISRLGKNATNEEFYEYYMDQVETVLDPASSITTLRVRAFTAEFARQMASEIIENSEILVNKMSERIIEDTLQFARKEVNLAEEQILKASEEVHHFRDKSKSIDPGKEISGVLGIVAKLEGNLAETRAELIAAESYMNQDSVQIKNLHIKVNALTEMVKEERKRLAAEDENIDDYTQLIYDYEPLELNKVFAERQYTSALTSLELARADAQRKQRYLLPFVTPKIPDEAVEPDRLMEVLTVFTASLLIYAIGGLMWAAIKDHMRN